MLVPFGSVMNGPPGEARSLFAVRLIAYLKFFAVTGLPSLNLKPFRIVNVYRFPLLETVKFEATSGTSFDPGGPAYPDSCRASLRSRTRATKRS